MRLHPIYRTIHNRLYGLSLAKAEFSLKAIPLKKYEEDLHRLDVALRELKIKYDQFFARGLDRQPVELRQEVERMLAED